MVLVSLLLGLLSVATAYYWWTLDWWHPATFTGTRVGFEDFLMGFASGGIMAVAYEVAFKKSLYRVRVSGGAHRPDHITLLLLLAFLTAWLFWGVGLTSFWASTFAMLVTAGVLVYFRRDLFMNALMSGFLMMVISSIFYLSIMWFSPTWIAVTYTVDTLSGVSLYGVPIEEFIFWFLSGLVFGPFYEYWQGSMSRRRHASRKLPFAHGRR